MKKIPRSLRNGPTLQAKSQNMTGEITWEIAGRQILRQTPHLRLTHAQHYRYQRAYVDFFEDELVLNGYDWRKVLDEYLFIGDEPLINGLIAACTACYPVISRC
jgi:hypothetical protein